MWGSDGDRVQRLILEHLAKILRALRLGLLQLRRGLDTVRHGAVVHVADIRDLDARQAGQAFDVGHAPAIDADDRHRQLVIRAELAESRRRRLRGGPEVIRDADPCCGGAGQSKEITTINRITHTYQPLVIPIARHASSRKCVPQSSNAREKLCCRRATPKQLSIKRNMKLGFVTAILPELNLNQVLKFATAEHFACIEPMCWRSEEHTS